VDFIKERRDKPMLLDILCTTKEWTAALWKLHVCRVHYFLKCRGNVTKQTSPLQVDNLITYKSVAILEASQELRTHCVDISALASMKNF
jgi:hypothetical protein